MLYRLITEDKNRQNIIDIIKRHFDGFTLISATGCWQGTVEHSLIIEICYDVQSYQIEPKINVVAREIKELNNQQSVLIQKIEVGIYLI